MRAQPALWDGPWVGDIPFVPDGFHPARGELRADQLDWPSVLPPPDPAPEPALLEEATLARLPRLPKARGHLGMHVTYAPFTVRGLERPYFPQLALAPGVSGTASFGQAQPAAWRCGVGDWVASGAEAVWALAETIRVRQPGEGAMLAQVASQLDRPVIEDA